MGLPVIVAGVYGAYKVGSWLWDKIGGLAGATSIADAVKRNIPILEDEVTVEVIGQPGASKQELYFLALTAANGIVRRFQPLLIPNPLLPATAALLMIEYDAADNWVRCTLRYRQGTARNNILRPPELVSTTRPTKDFYDNMAVYRGPQCGVVGGTLDFTSLILPGVPVEREAPTLPFAGRVILTSCPTTTDPQPIPAIDVNPVPNEAIVNGPKIKSPNPKPPGDNRSRGAVFVEDGGASSSTGTCCPKKPNLVQLVFAALTDPGSFADEMFVGPAQGPLGT